jgi:hypothetical protein
MLAMYKKCLERKNKNMGDGLYGDVINKNKARCKVKSFKVVDETKLNDIEQLLYDVCIWKQELYKTNEITYSLLKDLSYQLNALYLVNSSLLKALRERK